MKITGMVGAALVLGLAWASGAVAQEPAGDAANGAKVYVAVGCFTCHGRSGQGGNFNYATPVLAKIQWPVEAFRAFLRSLPGPRSPADIAQLAP